MDSKNLILRLHEINAIKFGEFTLKNGALSPFYIDLRVTVSYPKVIKEIANLMWEKAKDLKFDYVCGIPYTALPFSTAISLEHNIPMLMKRKETKKYGTKKLIEGEYSAGQTCLIIDDMITDGASKFESINPLQESGLKVTDIIILLDREQGGPENLASKGYNLHTIFKFSDALKILLKDNRVDQTLFDKISDYVKQNQLKK